MASRLRVAVVAVTHFSKGGGTSANNRIIGSIAFVAAARAAFIVSRDPDDENRRLFVPSKNNLGPDRAGLAFRIETREVAAGIIAPARGRPMKSSRPCRAAEIGTRLGMRPKRSCKKS
jgi:hypothetical protein